MGNSREVNPRRSGALDERREEAHGGLMMGVGTRPTDCSSSGRPIVVRGSGITSGWETPSGAASTATAEICSSLATG
eukprot:751802-Hanusia_phi.AAC.4